MIHWQNNTESTNFLVLDYSDPEITNSAAIKYPGESIVLLSDFFGNEAPNMSFHVRVNTLDDGSPITNSETLTYNVHRGLASEFPDISNWDLLNPSPITEVSLVDVGGGNLDPNEYYRYAVETIYIEGESEVTFSNSILGGVLNNSDFDMMNANIAVYPVPTSDQITISLGLGMQTSEPILAYDTLGRKVLEIDPSEINNGMVTKNVNHLQSGMYFIKINIGGTILNKKFIVN